VLFTAIFQFNCCSRQSWSEIFERPILVTGNAQTKFEMSQTKKQSTRKPRTQYGTVLQIFGAFCLVAALYRLSPATKAPTKIVDLSSIKMPKDWSVLEAMENDYGRLIAFKGPNFRILSCGESFLGMFTTMRFSSIQAGFGKINTIHPCLQLFPSRVQFILPILQELTFFRCISNQSTIMTYHSGLGIGIVARMVSQFSQGRKLHIDAVDINDGVIQMAHKHFYFNVINKLYCEVDC
jgi:hypothetical protein